MTSATNGAVGSKFVTATLPRLAGTGALLIYLLTLNHWVSLPGLGTVARVSGWSWQPQLNQPLTWAVFGCFRALPDAWIPWALNLMSAVCAALVLLLLARSAALLPYDITPEKPCRGRGQPAPLLAAPGAWMPPLLAVCLCGLQLTFWEHATSATGEMLDLLVFACVIWCLLEFRIDREQRWLSLAAFVYGVGMANNWAMVGFFPLFLAAILRTKGLGPFLKFRFLRRMAGWGLAGLSLYLLLPAAQSLFGHGQVGFWPALKANLGFERHALNCLQNPLFRALVVTSLLPFLVLSIRWKSHSMQSSDDSRLGVFLAKSTVHFVHALFLLSSLWLALDPDFGPRRLDLGVPMLPLYYVSALVGGYCAGYFLLLGSRGKQRRTAGPALAGVFVLLCATPLALGVRNLGQIRMTNGPAVHEFARQLYADLPAGKSVALSDEPAPLLLLRAELAAHHHDKEVLPLNAPALASVQYQLFMAGQFKSRWPATLATNRFDVVGRPKVLALVAGFAASEPVVYLHPGCSFFFESFLGQPRGLVQCLTAQWAAAGSHPAGRTPDHQLADEASALLPQDSPVESADAAAFEADSLLPRRLPEPLAAANERLWQQRWTNNLQALADQAKPAPHPASPLLTRLRLTPERNLTVASLGSAYSRSLNDWGVELQRLGRWTEAGVWFHRAFELSPDNLAARINLEYNQRCAQGDKAPLDPLWVEHQFPGLFEKHSNWRDVIEADGPLDEPASLFRAAHALLAVRNNHQAARDFARCAELAPDWLQPKLWLAQTRLRLRDFPGALDLTDHLMAPNSPQDGGDLSQLLYCRATALRALGRTNEAAACIEGFLAKYRAQEEILLAASELYSDAREFESELALLDELLERGPNRADLLVKKGLAQMQLSKYDDAIATLTKALALAPSDSEARLYRAVACLRAGQLEAARGDYLELLHKAANPQPALFGLGGIAWRQHDTNVAIGFYQQFLSNALQGSVQYTVASKRLERLKKPGMDAPAGPGAQPRQ